MVSDGECDEQSRAQENEYGCCFDLLCRIVYKRKERGDKNRGTGDLFIVRKE